MRRRALLFILSLWSSACSSELNDIEPYRGPDVRLTLSPDETLPADWSLTRLGRPRPPEVARAGWARNPIDQFVLHRIEGAGLEPAAEEAPARLLRRLTLVLTGLPPTPKELAQFAADPSDAAYERAVDRLLGQLAFGEERARHWLDVARYADTHGYHYDNYRSVWPYRDYVIDAFNSGKGFDQFTLEQLAGDLLPHAGEEQRIATGFIRAALSTNEAGIVEDEYAAIYAKDRVDALAMAWLGLTVGCASCHDHVYDPITQKDFYALTAFFRNTTEPVLDGNRPDAPPTIVVSKSKATTLVVQERRGNAEARVLERGRYDAPGERVSAAVPARLPQLADDEPRNRLGLARWLLRADNPLTARVVVNRFWSEVFGVGLVRTANDFGRIGAKPSHPALLDWLAVEFRESGWDVKHLFRLMVSSATYRQACQLSEAQQNIDPDNRLLAHGPRFRMDGETLRDLALAASGLLVQSMGGPSVKPYQPPNVWEAGSPLESNTAVYEQDHGDALYRRSVYTFWKRTAPPPAFEAFDAPARDQSVAVRERTNTPLQALVTMNDVQLVEAARVLASHALAAERKLEARLDYISRRVLARPLTAAEIEILSQLAQGERARFAADPDAAQALLGVGESAVDASHAPDELAAWTLVANTLLNLDEALTQ